jgi:hypothetical protein
MCAARSTRRQQSSRRRCWVSAGVGLAGPFGVQAGFVVVVAAVLAERGSGVEYAGRVEPGAVARRGRPVGGRVVLVDRRGGRHPASGDRHAGLVLEPAVTGRVPAGSGRVDQRRGGPLHPVRAGDLVDGGATLRAQLLDVAVAEGGSADPPAPRPRCPPAGSAPPRTRTWAPAPQQDDESPGKSRWSGCAITCCIDRRSSDRAGRPRKAITIR